MDSGHVVSVVRSVGDIRLDIVGDGRFVGLTLPGNPCDVVLFCSRRGAEALTARLADGVERLDAAGEGDK